MLTITVPKGQFFQNSTNTFIYSEETELQLEHSLLSLSKWESKWHKPFLDTKEKTEEELIDYVRPTMPAPAPARRFAAMEPATWSFLSGQTMRNALLVAL